MPSFARMTETQKERMTGDPQTIGRRVQLARERRGLTRGQLSYHTGVPTHTIGRIERGQGDRSSHLGPLLAYLGLGPAKPKTD
jgi:DNA-binding XRE family transcriptional regulator